MLIDTHCHLNFEAFRGKVDGVIKEAKETGVGAIIVPGAKLDSSQKAIELAEKYEGVYAAVGIHPIHAERELSNSKSQIPNILRKLAKNKKVIAIGECGMDNYHFQYQKLIRQLADKNQNDILKLITIQKQLFVLHVKLARELKLPLIIHNRQATTDIFKLLNLKPLNRPLVFHCFEGDSQIWQWAKDKPHVYIGITANITYNQKLQAIIKHIPLTKILLETDSPWQRPKIPNKPFYFPNKPINVKIVAQAVARLKRSDLAEVADHTTRNAKRLFNLK